MKTISFRELYLTDYNLGKIFAMEQRWGDNVVFNTFHTPRITNCLLYLCGCSAVYTRNDFSTLKAPQGSIVYVPQGTKYKVEFLNTAKSGPHTILVEFNIKNKENIHLIAASDITVLDKNPNPAMVDLFYEMASVYTRPVISYSVSKSVLYKILSELSSQSHSENIFSKDFKSIAKGILYMEKNINQSLSIEAIASMCHVSPSCFRRLFRKYSGMSPVTYRTKIKIDYAKKLLKSNTMKVSQIADMLGYEDTSYFCRLFKKNTGHTPAEYADIFKLK